MKKIFCGAVIALIGTIFSIALIVMATINNIQRNGQTGLWGLLQGYGVDFLFVISLIVVIVGIAVCIWGTFEKEK